MSDERTAWRRLSRRVLHSDRWITHFADRVALPGGGELDPFHVLELRDWVAVCPMTADNRIVLVEAYRYPVDRLSIEFPGGMIEAGEAPETAARRELLEETGCTAAHLHALPPLYQDPSRSTQSMFGFLAIDAERQQPPRDDHAETLRTFHLDRVDLPRFLRENGERIPAAHLALALQVMLTDALN